MSIFVLPPTSTITRTSPFLKSSILWKVYSFVVEVPATASAVKTYQSPTLACSKISSRIDASVESVPL